MKQKYTITQRKNKNGNYFVTYSVDGQEILREQNPTPKKSTGMKIFISHGWHTAASGKVENFMLTTPSCESKAPPGWDKKEVDWNTFIYYKKFNEKTKADAKNFCRTFGKGSRLPSPIQEMEDEFYTSLVETDQAYWLGVSRDEDEDLWETDKGRKIKNYGVYDNLDETTPWSADYKTATGVLNIPDDQFWLVTGKNNKWFPTPITGSNGQKTTAMTICTHICRHYENFP